MTRSANQTASGTGADARLLPIASPGRAAPEQKRWRGRITKLLLVVAAAGTLAVAVSWGLFSEKPLSIRFCGFTNVYQFDRPVAVFTATNRNSRPLSYATHIESKTDGSWPAYLRVLPHNESLWTTIPAGSEFTIRKLPPTGGGPWRISLLYFVEETPFGRARWDCARFFYDLNLDAIGQFIHAGARGYLAFGPEIPNDQAP
jgi:hypothetical protein